MALALKSKTGCLNCKRKRVKCDERHPSCLRCQKTGIKCSWQGRVPITSGYMHSSTALGNTYATLFLQDENVNFKFDASQTMSWSCPAQHISSGYPQFNDEQEHRDLIMLSSFLSMLTLDRQCLIAKEPKFEFTVALQEPWVRNALLAFAGFVNGLRDRTLVWEKVLPYYTSTTRMIQHILSGSLDEARLEQLLIASQFLGMIEINNPENEVFPLLHFEAVGRILETLHLLQAGKTISPATKRFHRIAIESYLYHVAIQSMFYPQTDRYPTMSKLIEPSHELAETSAAANIITKLDLKIYVILLKLARLSRIEELTAEQQAQANALDIQLNQIETKASTELETVSTSDGRNTKFLEMTRIGTGALAIFSAKVRDRSLLAKNPEIRPLVERLLHRLAAIQPSRQWTGDFVWVLTIVACAVHTPNECKQFADKVQQFYTGLWGADLKRMKAVLQLVRSKRAAFVRNVAENKDVDVCASDTLSILVNSNLSLD